MVLVCSSFCFVFDHLHDRFDFEPFGSKSYNPPKEIYCRESNKVRDSFGGLFSRLLGGCGSAIGRSGGDACIDGQSMKLRGFIPTFSGTQWPIIVWFSAPSS